MTDDAERERASPSPATSTPRPGTTHPHLARERALKVLFAADVRGIDPRVLLDDVDGHPADLELLDELEPDQEQVAGDEELQQELSRRSRQPLDGYTRMLVDGVAARRHAIDQLLGEVADRWAVQRMPVVDRNLLRLAIYELAEQDTPHAVVIDEAVSLAVAFAGEKAQSFVNGVLETVRQRVVAGELELALTSEPTDKPSEEAGPTGEGGPADRGRTDEVDPAAQEAYDLALDLLDAEGPLETDTNDDEFDDAPAPDDEVEPDEDPDARREDRGAALRDDHDALW